MAGTFGVACPEVVPGQWERVDSHVTPDQIANTIFKDMYRFARYTLDCYASDLMHDARHLIEFERKITLFMAQQAREAIIRYKVEWHLRVTGTDYRDPLVKGSFVGVAAAEQRAVWIIHWGFRWEDGSTSLELWRQCHKHPAEAKREAEHYVADAT